MQRTLCAGLILFFWLGPIAAIFPASSEARLPACCRRNGAHHCAFTKAMAAQPALTGSSPALATPAHCSNYPACAPAATRPIEALVASSTALPRRLAATHSHAASRAAVRLSELRTRANRGPPTSHLA